MPIKASSGREIESLVAGLRTGGALARAASVARLTVIGTRAVGRLVELLDSNCPAAVRVAAMQVFEGVGDPRVLDTILSALKDEDPDVAVAAVSAAASFLTGPRGADVLDRLTGVALDSGRPQTIRVAAVDALAGIRSATLKPLWKALATDPEPLVRTRVESIWSRSKPSNNVEQILGAACEGDLPDPGELQRAIIGGGATLPLPMLQQLVERIRECEASAAKTRRMEWTKARAAAHVALAQRNSRLALYDLREALESATTPLPVELLTALSQIGDSSCLESIANAYVRAARAGVPPSDWWRQHLASAFRAIVERDRLTMRHAVMKKVAKRWGDEARELLQAK